MIVARGYPTDKYKMNGNFEFDQAKALVRAGCKVVFAAIDVRSIRRWRKWGIEKKKIDGVEIYAINIPLGNVPKIIFGNIAFLGLKMIYKKILNEIGKPDIVHAHFLGSAYLSAKLLNNSETPLVITEHSSLMNQNEISTRLLQKASYSYNKANQVIAVSHHLANNIGSKLNIKPIVIPNVVDLDSFEYVERNKPKDFFSFVSTGHLLPNKNMSLLIESFTEAFKENNKVTLYIFGEGSERQKLENIIQVNNMNDQIHLMGVKVRKEIAKKMSESNCFVLASKKETFGVAYIEAMAMGLPVIATKCGGPEDFVNNKNGLLINVDDKNELMQAMKYMYQNSSNYISIEIANSVKMKFGEAMISNQLINIYQSIIKKD